MSCWRTQADLTYGAVNEPGRDLTVGPAHQHRANEKTKGAKNDKFRKIVGHGLP